MFFLKLLASWTDGEAFVLFRCSSVSCVVATGLWYFLLCCHANSWAFDSCTWFLNCPQCLLLTFIIIIAESLYYHLKNFSARGLFRNLPINPCCRHWRQRTRLWLLEQLGSTFQQVSRHVWPWRIWRWGRSLSLKLEPCNGIHLIDRESFSVTKWSTVEVFLTMEGWSGGREPSLCLGWRSVRGDECSVNGIRCTCCLKQLTKQALLMWNIGLWITSVHQRLLLISYLML